jgi:hypothetical protein
MMVQRALPPLYNCNFTFSPALLDVHVIVWPLPFAHVSPEVGLVKVKVQGSVIVKYSL